MSGLIHPPHHLETVLPLGHLAFAYLWYVAYTTGGTHAVDELRLIHAPSESVVDATALADPVSDFDGWR